MYPSDGGQGWQAHARREVDPRDSRSAAPSQVPPDEGTGASVAATASSTDVHSHQTLQPVPPAPYAPPLPHPAPQLVPVPVPYDRDDPPGPSILAPFPVRPPLPLEHTVLAVPPAYTHDTTFASVESARWNTLPDPSWVPAVAGPSSSSSRHDSLGLGPSTSWTEDGRRYSTASSTSGDSYTTSPLAGGVVALPEVANETLAPEIKPFVQKLYNLLADPQQYQDVILWNHTGDAFFVAHNDRFINEVLQASFGHQNIHSFTRQLNVYRFQRMTVAQLRAGLDLEGRVSNQYSGWSHPNFRRGGAASLHLLAPRPSRARIMRKLEKQSQGGATARLSKSPKESFMSSQSSPLATTSHLALPPADLPPPPLTAYRLPQPPPLNTLASALPQPYYDPHPPPAMQTWHDSGAGPPPP
ncbi:HSF-type DNA-binding-domain containing protein [Rhodotorula toruloides]|uniref:HSF-type DNA-binding-domain containing protein n=1 Tax=Rhodotorula toruloides TaxID=5286 RepID=A0A2T0AG05_RHOTO|nr:HSF-type DNA-binding-domain containing protein [Rhodotorula toruloides]PRQ76943.1 HSF-type DNA-binding-domain containing protein [Rhodotorula toruloides]